MAVVPFALSEGVAEPNGTRVFDGVATAAGQVLGLDFVIEEPEQSLVTSVVVGGVEQLSGNVTVAGLVDRQNNAQQSYPAVALNDAVTVKLVGGGESISVRVEDGT